MNINGKQVGLLLGKAQERGMSHQALLEWLEFDCEVNISSLEEIKTSQMPVILAKFEDVPLARARR